MLQDYRNYIVNIRNGLIQCGVDVSISPLATYKDLFYEADKLAQILWFYSIMSISNSNLALDGFFIDISGYYKEKMRQMYYKEFQDYYDSYKHISKLAYLAGDNGSNVVAPEEVESEEFDLFSPEEPVVGEVDTVGTAEAKEPESKPVAEFEEVHGTFIDENNLYENIDKVLGTGYIPAQIGVNLMVQGSANTEVHGVFLDEVEITEADTIGVLEDSEYYSIKEDVHGTILEDVVLDESSVSVDDGYDDIHYSNDEDDGYYQEEGEEEPYDDIHYSDEDEEPYDDIHYSDEDEEPYDDIHYSNDEDEFYDDIHYASGEEDEPYDDIHYADDDDEYVEPQKARPVVKPNTGTKSTKVEPPVRDMTDVIQDGVNAILTKGKRIIITESRKLRNGDEK